MCIPSFTGRFANKLSEPPRHRLQLKQMNYQFRGTTMSKLFFVNIPYNCTDRELQEFVESRGIPTRSIRIIRDLVAGVSPAFGYVELTDDTALSEAISILNGKRLRNQIISVREDRSMAASALERRSA